jgi:hypothetical protein
MSTRPLSKTQLREVRRLNGIAYERELAKAASDLQTQFESWRRGKSDVFALNEQIHQYHNGISRDLYKRYVMGEPTWNLATAINRKVIKEAEVDSRIMENIRSLIGVLEQI